MQCGSRISLSKLLWRHPLPSSPTPISPISLTSPTQAQTRLAFTSVLLFSKPYLLHSQAQFLGYQTPRRYTSATESGAYADVNKQVDGKEIETPKVSKETFYFDEEPQCPKAAVKEVLEKYEGLMAKLSEPEKAALHRSMGQKIEQFKAELKQMEMEDQ
ncbi:hypothetical protein SLE2022_239160 [Rubroshorea leprosula]